MRILWAVVKDGKILSGTNGARAIESIQAFLHLIGPAQFPPAQPGQERLLGHNADAVWNQCVNGSRLRVVRFFIKEFREEEVEDV